MSTTDIEIDYEGRVRRGAELLDRVKPGWAAEIATDWLAMASCDACILGQLYGSYWAGFQSILETLSSTQLYSSSDHGFTLRDREQPCESEVVTARFARLADAWRAEIRRRTEPATTT